MSAVVDSNHRGGKSPAAFRTIREVAADLDVPQHVLRFWESKFTQIRPMKRGGGRRYYRPEDVRLLRAIRRLLYDDGFTIRGVQKLLRSGAVRPDQIGENGMLPFFDPPAEPEPVAASRASAGRGEPLPATVAQRSELREMLRELKALRDLLMQASR